MAEYVLLDSSPLGLACGNPLRSQTAQCLNWIDSLLARGVVIFVPEIADYEVRRELTRIRSVPSLTRLDALVSHRGLRYAPITTGQMREASILWGDARNRGLPTASLDALDADVILAACAATIGQAGDQIIVATSNVGHLAHYCDARLWMTIT
jgi:hypothetical protein